MDTESRRQNRQALISELENAGTEFRGNSCKCPFHDDNRPSAGVYQDDGGVWRFKCQSCGVGGDVWDVIARIEGRTVAEVLKAVRIETETKQGKSKKPKIYADIEELKQSMPGTVEALYNYTNPDTGRIDMLVIRCKTANGKTFRQASPQRGGYVMQAPPKPWPIYNRGRIRQADTVVVVEGEKCVHALHEYGIVATTSPAGAGKSEYADWTPLAGKNVILWPDADEPGRSHMRQVEAILQNVEPKPRIALIEPNDLDLHEKEDAADYIAQLQTIHSDKSKTQQAILEAVNQARSKGASSGVVDLVEASISGKRVSIKWPWSSVDRLTKALLPGTLTLLCGNIGASKSFLLLEAAAFWHDAGIKTAIYELEENRAYHLLRALAQRSKTAGMTDPDWTAENPEQSRVILAEHKDFLDTFGGHVFASPESQPTLTQVSEWVRGRAKAGCRIIAVDPVTGASHQTRNVWEEDGAFLSELKRIVVDFDCSVILVTHPIKAVSFPDVTQLSGGAAYSRFAQSIVWLESHTSKTDEIATALGPAEMDYNRTLHILKARNARGQGLKLGFEFDSESLTLSERGLIMKAKK